MARTGPENPDGGPAKKGGKASVELFDLKNDPYEQVNLAAANPEKVKQLQAALATFARQAVPSKNRPKPKGFVSPKVWGEKE